MRKLNQKELITIDGGNNPVSEWIVDTVAAGICATRKGINEVDQALGYFFFGDHGWWR